MLVAGSAHTVAAPEPAAAAFPTVGTSANAYQPGHTSGWHIHPGVHSVVVLGGTLTVYDENCRRTEYGPGQTYLGGGTPHVARNESPEVLDVAITFVYSPATEDHGQAVPPPAGCELR
jgi:quercetin dioxygenase-like cupin family protein